MVTSDVKMENKSCIFRYIYGNERVSKQEISNVLGYSLPTVTQNLRDLERKGLVIEGKAFDSTGGRPAISYMINSKLKYAIGIDINKERLTIVILDLRGNPIQKQRYYIKFENTDQYYQTMSDYTKDIMKSANITDEKLLGIGIAVQGIVSSDNNEIIYGPILDITGETVEKIAKYLPSRTYLFHDTDMGAFAETWGNKDLPNAVYLSLSTNLGGAVVENGRILLWGKFGNCRVEHMTVVPGGKRCYCGKDGCAEMYTAISTLTDHVEDHRLETFFEKLHSGEKKLAEVWNEYLEHLSIVINNTKMMYDGQVILGGYLGEFIGEWMPELKQLVYGRNSFNSDDDYLVLGKYQKDPIAIGSALQIIELFLDTI